jgi:hypothetical protein
LVWGRGTGGSAVTGFDDPTCGVDGVITTWAPTTLTDANKKAAVIHVNRRMPGEFAVICITGFLSSCQVARPIYHGNFNRGSGRKMQMQAPQRIGEAKYLPSQRGNDPA